MMLVLTRNKQQIIRIGEDVIVTVLEVRRDRVRLGIVAPSSVPVHRGEVYDAIHKKQENDNAG